MMLTPLSDEASRVPPPTAFISLATLAARKAAWDFLMDTLEGLSLTHGPVQAEGQEAEGQEVEGPQVRCAAC